MKRGPFPIIVVPVLISLVFATSGLAQQGPTELNPRLKLDALVIVAHSDDETVISPYLARVTLDQKKTVGVVFIGSGAGGFNRISRERGHALGLLRRMEAQEGLVPFGIKHVWFVGERLDNGSSNPFVSLASFGHGATLEKVVRLVRATRPDVLLAWLPAQVIGENHGDHQAAGVIAAEAFDMSADPTAFPVQVASFGAGTEGLAPWTPRKLYYFSDAFSLDFLKGTGPAFSVFDMSPTRKQTYLALAAAQIGIYQTQFTDDLGELFGVDLKEVTAALGTSREAATLLKLTRGASPAWVEPTRLLRARSRVGGDRTEDVFDGLTRPLGRDSAPGAVSQPAFEIGGPWAFSRHFAERHHLDQIGGIAPELAVHPVVRTASIPLRFTNLSTESVTVRLTLETPLPSGWSEQQRAHSYHVGPGTTIEAVSVLLSPGNGTPPWIAAYRADVGGKLVGRAKIKLQVAPWTLRQ